MKPTLYNKATFECDNIFRLKFKEYGKSWKAFRPKSLTDQIFMKIMRLRQLDEGTKQLVNDENHHDTLYAIYNYCIIRSIMNKDGDILELYTKGREAITELKIRKDNDYGSIWKELRIGTLIDLMLAKMFRIRNQEDTKGDLNIEELFDIANYAIFTSIRYQENEK